MVRSYDMSARAAGVEATRTQILATARGLLLDGGYAAMTIASLAQAARVSPQTVYNSIGGKPAVVKAVYDGLLAADDAQVAMSDRSEFRAVVSARSRKAFAGAYAAWVRMLHERVGPLLGVLTAHGVDATLVDFLATIERERYTGCTHALTGLRHGAGLPAWIATEAEFTRLVDAVWTLIAPDGYDRLVRRCGWSAQQYEDWLSGQLGVLLGVRLSGPRASAPRRG